MSVVVRKSPLEVVRPPAPVTTTDDINLSPYDRNVVSMQVPMFLVFERPIHKAAETIKEALSRALAHYLPVSGRLAAAGPELRIAQMGEGVPFVAAAAICALKDVELFDKSAVTGTGTHLVEELAVYYPGGGLCGLNDPLLMMQVTEFSCGGFVVGVTWNHALADAAGMGQFMQAVGELARGLPSPSVVPVRWDDSLRVVPPSVYGLVELMMSLQRVDMAILDITVPARVINNIKEDHRRVRSKNGRPCTTFEAVTALLWQCRTRAIASNPEDPVALYFTVNARKYVGARDGYYGNCLTGRLVVAATGDEVANGDLMDVVEMIRRAKSQLAEVLNNGAESDGQHVGNLAGYNLLVVSSWRDLGVEEADFGGGRPARVMSYSRRQQRVGVPACVVYLPYQGIDGYNMISACVTKDHAAAFMEELSSRFN